MREVEAKIRIEPAERDALRDRLRALGAEPGRVDDESNLLFDDAGGRVRASGQTLRLRRYAGRADASLTFKGERDISSRYKSREELEVDVSDGDETERILLAMGFLPVLGYSKHREHWSLPDVDVALDHVDAGDFIEIEGPEEAIDRLLARLGLEGRRHVRAGYPSLVGQPPAGKADDGIERRSSAAFRNRADAGRALADRLVSAGYNSDSLVLALPRGGVPVAFEVARALQAPLDCFLVRKLGVPGQRELAMGAIASGDVRILNSEVIDRLTISPEAIERVTRDEQRELERRTREYLGGQASLPLAGRGVILVDDGIATGSSMRAAIAALRKLSPATITVATPVAARCVCDELRAEVDDVICVHEPETFAAVGSWYDDFSPVSDAEVRELLRRSGSRNSATQKAPPKIEP